LEATAFTLSTAAAGMMVYFSFSLSFSDAVL
jgi:hypothetical protein